MISLKEIGKICGLSESTVCKALKGRSGIKTDTVERVRSVARQYGYQPNAMVECIQTGQSRSIGIAFNRFQCEFAGGIMEGIHQALHEHNYDSYLISWDRLVADRQDIVSRFTRRRVDGLLLFPMASPPRPEYWEALNRFQNPIILIDSKWPGCNFELVASDNAAVFRKIIKSLYEEGYRKIGTVSYTGNDTGMERRQAFFEAMAEYNLPVNAKYCMDISDCWKETYSRAKILLSRKNRPDALVCFNDYVAADVMNAAYDLGIRVPEELGVTGMGDIPLASRLRPKLSTAAQKPELIGRTAAELLFDRINGIPPQESVHRIPSEFIQRGSSEKRRNT